MGWSDYGNVACLLQSLSWYTAKRERVDTKHTRFVVRFTGLCYYSEVESQAACEPTLATSSGVCPIASKMSIEDGR